MAIGVKTRRWPPRHEELMFVKDVVATMTAGNDGGSLRVDFTRLSADGSDRLIELTTKAMDGPGFNIERLAKRDRERWEELVERATAREGYFQKARDDGTFAAELAEISRLAKLPPRRVRCEEQGSIRLPASIFGLLDRHGKKPAITIETLGILAFVLLQLENGKALSPRSSIVGAGDSAAVVFTDYGLGMMFSEMTDWRRRIDHLGTLGWLSIEAQGQELRVSRGPLSLKAARGTS